MAEHVMAKAITCYITNAEQGFITHPVTCSITHPVQLIIIQAVYNLLQCFTSADNNMSMAVKDFRSF